VPIAVGSVTDVIMRAAAPELASGLAPIVVENKGGASGIPGAQACAQAQPDGYTLCLVYHSTMSINPLIFDKLPYDPDKDFVPITNLFLLVEGLFVSTSLGVDSVADLKKAAQAKPNAFNYGTLGPGSYPDLFLRWVNKEWSTDIVGIPYRGGGPIAQELVAGQLQIAKMGIGNFLGLLSTGKIKPPNPQKSRSRSDRTSKRDGSCGAACSQVASPRPIILRGSLATLARASG
jgi:tripartite-type tricarboxylate transporter receptor subunit TctC